MKKNYFCLLGIIALILINYILSNYTKEININNINTSNILKILKQSIQPQLLFLLLIFFSRENIKVKNFTFFISFYIIVELIFRYFNQKNNIDYNYLIGMLLGILLVFLIDKLKIKYIDQKK
ncbi:hypothetical protein [Polaribacter tangerinus]|uniref:hypothetical protein n=1 Tax=Polaribacter tangerinus TaxID=1920034 RepID=UPI000B4A8C35|nr:hypothetical protein [Polaribacter tangerinus]